MVTLICQGYFQKNILPLLKTAIGDLKEACLLFHLSAANNWVVSKYLEADITILGFQIPHVGFLVVKDPDTLLESQHTTQLLGVIGCNLVWLGCEEFRMVYGFDAFEKFHCPSNVHPLVFTQMCSHYHQGKLQVQTGSASQIQVSSINVSSSEISSEAKEKDLSPGLEMTLGQIWVGNTHQPMCILANSVKVVQGKTSKITKCLSCMAEAKSSNNLPMNIVVNRTMVTPSKSKQVPVVLVNTNLYNVLIHQSLLATDIVKVDHCPWDYQPVLSHEGYEIQVIFHPVPSPEVQEEIFLISVMNSGDSNKSSPKEQGKRSKFGS